MASPLVFFAEKPENDVFGFKCGSTPRLNLYPRTRLAPSTGGISNYSLGGDLLISIAFLLTSGQRVSTLAGFASTANSRSKKGPQYSIHPLRTREFSIDLSNLSFSRQAVQCLVNERQWIRVVLQVITRRNQGISNFNWRELFTGLIEDALNCWRESKLMAHFFRKLFRFRRFHGTDCQIFCKTLQSKYFKSPSVAFGDCAG